MRIALLPLDDRPCNLRWPVHLGWIADVEVLTPPPPLLGHFLEPGDPDALGRWLQQVAPQVDALAICLDMLAYGGLVASRLPERDAAAAIHRLGVLDAVRARHPHLPVYAASIIMRISITAAGHRDAVHWHAVHRAVALQGKLDAHGLSEEEQAELHTARAAVPPEVWERFWQARSRNHAVNLHAISLLRRGTLSRLCLAQEDAAVFGPHIAEQEKLQATVAQADCADRVHLYCGADELGMVMVARAVCDRLSFHPTLCIVDLPAGSGRRVAEFEDRPVADNVAEMARAAGLSFASAPELICVVHGPHSDAGPNMEQGTVLLPPSPFGWAALRGSFPSSIVGLVDACRPNGSDTALIEEVLACSDSLWPVAYASWGTAGNNAGTVIAHLTLLAAALRQGRLQWDAHASFWLERLADDWLYRCRIRAELAALAEEMAGPDAPLRLGTATDIIRQAAADRVPRAAQALFDRALAGRCLRVGEAGIRLEQAAFQATLPWERVFEADVTASAKMAPCLP